MVLNWLMSIRWIRDVFAILFLKLESYDTVRSTWPIIQIMLFRSTGSINQLHNGSQIFMRFDLLFRLTFKLSIFICWFLFCLDTCLAWRDPLTIFIVRYIGAVPHCTPQALCFNVRSKACNRYFLFVVEKIVAVIKVNLTSWDVKHHFLVTCLQCS